MREASTLASTLRVFVVFYGRGVSFTSLYQSHHLRVHSHGESAATRSVQRPGVKAVDMVVGFFCVSKGVGRTDLIGWSNESEGHD